MGRATGSATDHYNLAMGAAQRTRHEPPETAGDDNRGFWSKLPPIALALSAAALAVVLVAGLALALLLFRGGRGGSQEVVGSALPPGWQPGTGGGVGQAPPAPAVGSAARPAGTVSPAPEGSPYPAPPNGPDSEEGMGLESSDPSAMGQPLSGTSGEELTRGYDQGTGSFEPPHLIDLPTPDYPQMGRRMGMEGTVELQVLVDADGRVLAADPVGDRLGMGFESAARRAAFAARFAPARVDGRPVRAETRIAIRFRLR